ncbi:MAG: hypothetical protein IPI60_20220 [Saprospiraceae bacterium]|nr:hypothetical protein [Saprospiraceae bacterium]
MLEVKRQQGIKENLYLYLLEKGKEAALSLAAAVAGSRVIEPAYNPAAPVKPKRQIIWLIALSLGIILPLGLVYLIDMFNDKLDNEEDIKSITATPIAGVVAYNKKYGEIAIKEKSRSAVAEMFRLLRTNLQFVASGQLNQVFLVTSSSSGEGKSFVTLNLGITMALTGKKVLLDRAGFTKPKLVKYLGEGSQKQRKRT